MLTSKFQQYASHNYDSRDKTSKDKAVRLSVNMEAVNIAWSLLHEALRPNSSTLANILDLHTNVIIMLTVIWNTFAVFNVSHHTVQSFTFCTLQ